MACECVTCNECGGHGYIWVSINGKYLGKHRMDDMAEMESCEECDGSGVSEVCYDCQVEYEEDMEAEHFDGEGRY